MLHIQWFLQKTQSFEIELGGEREHENYGITHTIPYKFVDDKEKDMLQSNL